MTLAVAGELGGGGDRAVLVAELALALDQEYDAGGLGGGGAA